MTSPISLHPAIHSVILGLVARLDAMIDIASGHDNPASEWQDGMIQVVRKVEAQPW